MNTTIYIAYHFTVNPTTPGNEILIAELGYLGFESFVENDSGLTAYIQQADWSENILEEVQILKNKDFHIAYTIEEIEQVNWNEEWEKNFNPIIIGNVCSVRAPFHEKPNNVRYDIVIEPKMSFGTGHHETTSLMIQHLLEEDMVGKTVLDMGCGTGVLAILAEMRGANKLDAIDIDAWCYENALENVERNQCKHITVKEGDVALLLQKNYDVIIANINRNILLEDIPRYVDSLNKGGILFLSGFYTEDLPAIQQRCEEFHLNYSHHLEKNNWIAAKFVN